MLFCTPTLVPLSAKRPQDGPATGIALRGLFLINPNGVVEQITVNNLPVGRRRLAQSLMAHVCNDLWCRRGGSE